MLAVYKFQIKENVPFQVEVPASSKVIHIDLQQNNPVMWMEVDLDPKWPKVMKTFQIFGTGWEIPSHFVHRGTYQSPGQNFVWHLYEGAV